MVEGVPITIGIPFCLNTGVAQLVEQWSPKPKVVSSILTTRAKENKMSKVKTYFQESYEELVNKTSWPSWSELQKSSVLVAVASLVIALIIFAMDKIISTALEGFYNLF